MIFFTFIIILWFNLHLLIETFSIHIFSVFWNFIVLTVLLCIRTYNKNKIKGNAMEPTCCWIRILHSAICMTTRYHKSARLFFWKDSSNQKKNRSPFVMTLHRTDLSWLKVNYDLKSPLRSSTKLNISYLLQQIQWLGII